ncbi:unnamed protein product, partial [Vitis vinifera]
MGYFWRVLKMSLIIRLMFVAATAAAQEAKPGCQESCGNISIPYPFGTSPECYIAEEFLITCNTTNYSPPQAFLTRSNIQVLEILLQVTGYRGQNYTTGCVSLCDSVDDVINGINKYQQENTQCHDSISRPGYGCSCSDGYQGNPYLGCQDIDECSTLSPCNGTCQNLPGTFNCSCPKGYEGDGRKNGTGCTLVASQSQRFPLIIILGKHIILLTSSWIYLGLRERKLIKRKEKFFQKNGGLMLQHLLSKYEGCTETTKIFTAKDLQKATDNYHESRILGQGGQGTVYKGILPDNRVVAIKKSKVTDQSQVEQFVNEVHILSQINHRNVVKLLGCCLETEKERHLVRLFRSAVKEDRLLEVLDNKVLNEEHVQYFMEVAMLAKRCLEVKGQERPTMKEVAMELERVLKLIEKHPWVEGHDWNLEETQSLLNESLKAAYGCDSSNTTGYDSLKSEVKLNIDSGR